MDRQELYDKMAERKSKPKDYGSYIGDNGRVNRCVQLMQQNKIKTGGLLLDVGGGIGDLAYYALQSGLFTNTIVVDISSKNLEAANSKGCTTILVDVDKEGLPLEDKSCDVVTALDFIEHIVDPELFARECFRVLKPGGQVFINTPNASFFKHIETLIGGRAPHTSGDRDVYFGGHLSQFTFLDLCDIFNSSGFLNFKRLEDTENYVKPPDWLLAIRSTNQISYIMACYEFGFPNLLFTADKK